MLNIRNARDNDEREIIDVHISAFPDEEREDVANLAISLLRETTTPATISLIAEEAGSVIGHIALSPVTFSEAVDLSVYILGPLGIKPEHQKRGAGSALIKNSKQRLTDMSVDILLVYGDPDYYGRFGFGTELASQFVPPYKLEYPFGWQAVALGDAEVPEGAFPFSCVAALDDPSLW